MNKSDSDSSDSEEDVRSLPTPLFYMKKARERVESLLKQNLNNLTDTQITKKSPTLPIPINRTPSGVASHTLVKGTSCR